MIEEHRAQLDEIANTLLVKETIEGADFIALMGEKPGAESNGHGTLSLEQA
jgi:ATP-dependent Zn protease